MRRRRLEANQDESEEARPCSNEMDMPVALDIYQHTPEGIGRSGEEA